MSTPDTTAPKNLVTCFTCGHTYPDNTPAGRCPREAEHPDLFGNPPTPEFPVDDDESDVKTWTVVGIYNGADEPVVITVIEGDHNTHDGDFGGEWWADSIQATDAKEAARIATADRTDGDEDDDSGDDA